MSHNLVHLFSDEHNPFFSSVYGHPYVQTPHMQKLADEGTVYENAYCPSPLCAPCRSAMMAGRRVHEIQRYNNCLANMQRGFQSFGAALAEQGVHSVYIGKSDVYDQIETLGFSEVWRPGDRPYPGDTNHGRSPVPVRADGASRASQFGPRPGAGAGDAKCIDLALEWLEHTAPTLDRPWVLCVNLISPHFPHYCEPALWDLYPQGADLPAYGGECESANHPHALSHRRHFQADAFTPDQVRGLRRGYLGCVTFLDQQLGRLMSALQTKGLTERTNFIYSSDHGEMLGKFGMWWKCSLYEDSVRVPVIAAGPDFAKGKRVKTPVDLFDVQASFFHSTGAARPADWVGEPLTHIADDDPHRTVFSEYHGHGTPTSSFMVRQGRWKYIRYVDAPNQLFDLEADPDELNNLAASHAEQVAHMERELQKICDPEHENERAHQFIAAQLAALEADTAPASG